MSGVAQRDLVLDAENEAAVGERLITGIAIAVLIGMVFFAATTIGSAFYPEVTDARADWIAVTAANEGINPWTDLRVLAAELGTEYRPVGIIELGEFQRAHPRTPAALLLMWPLTLTTPEGAYVVMLVIGSIAMLAAGAVLMAPARNLSTIRTGASGATLLVGSAAYLATLKFGTQSTLILFLISIAWLLLKERDSVAGGIALGMVIGLRLFPALLLIPLWRYRKRRSVFSAVITFVTLNLVGLWFYDLNLIEAIEGLRTAADGWVSFSGNGSLLMPLTKLGMDVQITTTIVVSMALFASLSLPIKGKSFELSAALVMMISLLSSPISWEHYDVLAFLVVAFLVGFISRSSKSQPFVKAAVGLWLALQIISPRITSVTLGDRAFTFSGPMAMAGRLVLLAAVVYVFVNSRPDEADLRPSGREIPSGANIS